MANRSNKNKQDRTSQKTILTFICKSKLWKILRSCLLR